MSNQSDLEQAYENLIAAYKTASANPAPKYNVDGQDVDMVTYLEMLQKQIAMTKELIVAEHGPWEHQAEGII